MTSPINAAQVPPPPASGQVMILITELNPDGEGWQEHCRELPANEQERTHRFRYAADRLRFAKCRLMLREVVACWQCITKNEITFRFGKNGKPFLVQDHGLQFNISHTTGCAVLAFCHNHEIGIGCEHGGSDGGASLGKFSGRDFVSKALLQRKVAWRFSIV